MQTSLIVSAARIMGKLSFAAISFAQTAQKIYDNRGLSDGVMVAQSPLEALVMVRIHVGQPVSCRRSRSLILAGRKMSN
jgi:hypothetical protein